MGTERREAIQRALMNGHAGNHWVAGWADDLARRVVKRLEDQESAAHDDVDVAVREIMDLIWKTFDLDLPAAGFHG
jgi:hypothetical protein